MAVHQQALFMGACYHVTLGRYVAVPSKVTEAQLERYEQQSGTGALHARVSYTMSQGRTA